jgi:tetratricopeptide (TPR) repeat protein
LAIPLLLGGIGGALLARGGDKAANDMRNRVRIEAGERGADAQGGALTAALDGAQALRVPVLHFGMIGAAIVLVGVGLIPARRRGSRPKKASASAKSDAPSGGKKAAALASAPENDETTPTGKEYKKHLKHAGQLEDTEGTESAAEYLLGRNMKDEAVDIFMRAELFARAAEVRHDQNRFDDAADLYKKIGKDEHAGRIYAQLGRHDDAAKCYLAAGKFSVAGELFERAENYKEAGRCYQKIGFHRHAAQAYLKGGADAQAAESLTSAFNEEGGVAGAKSDQKAKEMRGIAKKAAEILAKLERFDEAETMLVRSEQFGPAAKIAFQTGNYKRAAELFLRVARGDLAAKALERLGDEVGAARALGEYLRDKGQDAEAVEHLKKAGENGAAGDLYRKLARFAEAGVCYREADDFPAAAEAFRAAGELEPAADAYAHCGKFAEAAECYATANKPEQQAEMLEKAGSLFPAGKLFASAGKTDAAIRLLQQIASDNPNYPEACSILGRMFQEKGMHSLSVKKFEEATGSQTIARGSVEAFYELGCAHERQNDLAGAIEVFERILSFDYHYKDAAACLERCKAALGKQTNSAGESHPPLTTPTGIPTSQRRYEIVRELGRGGMGVVYLARDSVLEREVAYKVLPEGLRGNPNALKNFLREAKAAAQLNHPNIVTVYDAGESEHGFYMAMELVEGTTLKEILRQRGAVSANAVLYILRQMASALSYAHGRKVVHRDIKTANTMWTSERHVKIMDFGLAKLMEEVRNATTMISGTPFYMSPEQTLGRDVDHRTDVYSLGVTIFELATGELPFQKGNVPYHHVHTAPPDPRQIKADVPAGLAAVILRCLQKAPAERFQTAKEILDELDRQLKA